MANFLKVVTPKKKQMNLQKLIVWVSILCSMLCSKDKIFKFLMNSTLEHDMHVPI